MAALAVVTVVIIVMKNCLPLVVNDIKHMEAEIRFMK